MSAKPESRSIKNRSGRVVELPTDDEDARINAGIAADPLNPELGEEWFQHARPAAEVLPAATYAGLVSMRRRPGERGPQKAPVKERISIRLSPDVAEYFRATGDGWQTRIDEALRDYVARHR
jgi:uncharacterized protein (DUF4415 family)